MCILCCIFYDDWVSSRNYFHYIFITSGKVHCYICKNLIETIGMLSFSIKKFTSIKYYFLIFAFKFKSYFWCLHPKKIQVTIKIVIIAFGFMQKNFDSISQNFN